MQKTITRLWIIFFLFGAATVCKADESLEAKLAKLKTAVQTQKTVEQSAKNPKPAPQAQDPNENLNAKVKSIESALVSLQAELEKLKSEQNAAASSSKAQSDITITQKQIDEMVSKAVGDKNIESTDLPEWVKKLKISGDLRYRHESIDTKVNNDWAQGQNRHRIRARLNVGAKVNDEMDVKFGIASGSADPVSTNQTLADSFSSKDLWLDLAYFDWHPLGMQGLNAFGGKMKNPFYAVGKNQLVWDSDLNPEGIATTYVIPLGDKDKLNVTGGGFWVDESSGGVDTSLFGAQAYLKHEFENKDHFLGGVSYFDYGNIKGRGDLKSTWTSSSSFFGNSATGSTFDTDFDIFEAFGEYGFKFDKTPAGIYGNYVKNRTATDSEDTGWLVGFSLNKAKEPGSWQFSYDYRDLDADAVLGAFTDSDFCGGGTNGRGHRGTFTYQVNKNVQAALTNFINKKGDNSDDYRRLQADLICKF